MQFSPCCCFLKLSIMNSRPSDSIVYALLFFQGSMLICNYRSICRIICFMSLSQLNYLLHKGGDWNWFFFLLLYILYLAKCLIHNFTIEWKNKPVNRWGRLNQIWGGIVALSNLCPFCWEPNHPVLVSVLSEQPGLSPLMTLFYFMC